MAVLPLSPTRLRFEDEDAENRDPATGLSVRGAPRGGEKGKEKGKAKGKAAGSILMRFLLCSRKANAATPRKPLPPTPRKLVPVPAPAFPHPLNAPAVLPDPALPTSIPAGPIPAAAPDRM
eukprot:tig00000367_g24449.t1